MDSDSLAIQIKSLAFYKDKAKDVKTRYDASNYEKKQSCQYLWEKCKKSLD